MCHDTGTVPASIQRLVDQRPVSPFMVVRMCDNERIHAIRSAPTKPADAVPVVSMAVLSRAAVSAVCVFIIDLRELG